MSSILSFLKKFFISSSSDEDASKYVELLNDSHVNQLNFPISDKEYQFNLRDLQCEKVICGNGNAMVAHYIFRPLEFSLVVKTLQIPIESKKVNEERLKTLIEEVKILRTISQGPNVTDFYGYAIDEEKIWIFMEFMEASLEDLYRYFHEKLYPKLIFSKEIVIPETVVSVIAVGILNALAFCKEQRVMHRDVKPSNVLVNKKGEVKLSDFGHSRILESGSITSSFKCTLQYLPPERFEDDQPEGYDDRTDVWSLGITLVEIAYGDIPYNVKELRLNEDYAKISNIIKKANGDEIMSRCFGEDYSDDLRDFVKSCLKELSSRPRYPQLMETNLYKSFATKFINEYTMKLFMNIYSESLNIEKNPLDANAYYRRGRYSGMLISTDAQKNVEKCNEAIADFTKAIELDPTNANAYYGRGNLQKELGNYNEAIADYTKPIELNPTDANAYYMRGVLQKKLGNYNEAIVDYTKPIELKPTDPYAYYGRGNLQKELGNYNEAIADYTKPIELKPDAYAYYWRGDLQKELGNYHEAIADFTKAIELDPIDVDAYYGRGDLQKELGNYKEAIADYTKPIELKPTDTSAYYRRGNLQKELGNYNEAIADYTKPIELKPTDADAYYNRGDLQKELGNYSEAIADYTKAIELKPGFDIAINDQKQLMDKINCGK